MKTIQRIESSETEDNAQPAVASVRISHRLVEVHDLDDAEK